MLRTPVRNLVFPSKSSLVTKQHLVTWQLLGPSRDSCQWPDCLGPLQSASSMASCFILLGTSAVVGVPSLCQGLAVSPWKSMDLVPCFRWPACSEAFCLGMPQPVPQREEPGECQAWAGPYLCHKGLSSAHAHQARNTDSLPPSSTPAPTYHCPLPSAHSPQPSLDRASCPRKRGPHNSFPPNPKSLWVPHSSRLSVPIAGV